MTKKGNIELEMSEYDVAEVKTTTEVRVIAFTSIQNSYNFFTSSWEHPF